jgi:hypothetical protein
MTTKLPERATLATAPAQPAGWKFERVDDRHIRVEDPAASYAVVIDMGDQAPVMRVFWRLCVDLIEWAASAAAPAVPPRAGDGNLPPLPGAAAFIVHRAMCEPALDWSEGDGWRNEALFTADQMRDYARAAAPAASAPAEADVRDAARYRALREGRFSFAPRITDPTNEWLGYTPAGLDKVCDEMVALSKNPAPGATHE